MEDKILFLGGGRRYELYRRFLQEGYKLYSYESNKEVPVKYFSEIIVGENWNSPLFYDHLLATLKSIHTEGDRIIIIPLQDEAMFRASIFQYALPPYACFYGSNPAVTLLGYDKKASEVFFGDESYYPKVKLGKEWIVKNRYGFGSKGLILNGESLDPEKQIVQRLIKGTEYSVDYLFSPVTQFTYIVRSREETAGGEVLRSDTIDVKEGTEFYNAIMSVGNKLMDLLAFGPINAQFIVAGGVKPYFIELNTRLGGGSTFSIEAGLDVFQHLLTWGQVNRATPYKKIKLIRTMRDFYIYEDSN